jgi:recombinational DNA repair protein (RecF pathway)
LNVFKSFQSVLLALEVFHRGLRFVECLMRGSHCRFGYEIMLAEFLFRCLTLTGQHLRQ